MQKRTKNTLGLSLSATPRSRHAPVRSKKDDEEKGATEETTLLVPSGISISVEEASPLPSSGHKRNPHGYLKVTIDPCVTDKVDEEKPRACNMVREALAMRQKYVFHPKVPAWERPDRDVPLDPWRLDNIPSGPSSHVYHNDKGVFVVYENQKALEEDKQLSTITPMTEFAQDYGRLLDIINNGPVKTFAYNRLKVLESRFQLHRLLNTRQEQQDTQTDDPKDFSNVIKVDTHIHLAAAMTAKHLLSFIKRKVINHPDEVVTKSADGKDVTLKEAVSQLGLDIDDFTVDMLDVRADNTFNRFDTFNNKYSPFGFSELRTIFLKTENLLNGRYFADLTKELDHVLEKSSYIKAEWRISIYGRKRNEWDGLADWICDHKLFSQHNRWLIQVPRLYEMFKKTNSIKNFQEVLDNVFIPLFEVTINPASNPKLHMLLRQVSGFDSVDDESSKEKQLSLDVPPEKWDTPENPSYAYYLYYMWANIVSLNRLREEKGFNTFDFRPHSGEAGSVDHLAASFILARGINHGINLALSPPLEYLYYLAQVGIAVSPLSNNALFLDYKRNPFPSFFKRGLNVSLSTDDPLQFHFTQTPLVEEYAIAAQCWQFNTVDLSEIAQNSVRQSGFEHEQIVKWLGPEYYKPGVEGNNIAFSNVPDGRVIFRYDTWRAELDYLDYCTSTRVRRKVSRESSAAMREEKDYTKITVTSLDDSKLLISQEVIAACKDIEEAVRARHRYYFQKAFLDENTDPEACIFETHETITFDDGVFKVYPPQTALCDHDQESPASVECLDCMKSFCEDCHRVLHKPRAKHGHRTRPVEEHKEELMFRVHGYKDFLRDYNKLRILASNSALNSFAQQRLELLEARFNFHKTINADKEKDAMKYTKKDFYHIYRVDTHIHAASAMTAPVLLDFIKSKFKHNGKDVVIKDGGVTLEQEFNKLGIPIENFTLDSLDVSANATTFGHFDKFNSKYNPFGNSTFRTIFLKKENDIEGKYFGELLRGELDRLELMGNEQVEWRISIYGEKPTEWAWLATWVEKHKLYSPNLRWMVQIPRLYHVLHAKNTNLHSFADMLHNIFAPLFEITRDPTSNPVLHNFLCNLSGFDSVDNEDVPEQALDLKTPTPTQWTSEENPPYAYYIYYLWANITTLNLYRESKGMNTFDFRPHSGASGSWEHLCASFLTAKNISHGTNLARNYCLQYLFYLCGIGVSISPLGEAALHVDYMDTHFYSFFKRGLNVSLATDNPLQLHTTPEPLIEEYSIASQMFRLDITDVSEIAKNSVLQSGFTHHEKVRWLGKNYWQNGVNGNDPSKSNLPNIRVAFRENNLKAEIKFVESVCHSHGLSHALHETSMRNSE